MWLKPIRLSPALVVFWAGLGWAGAGMGIEPGQASWRPFEIEIESASAESIHSLEEAAAARWEQTAHGSLIQAAGNAEDDWVRLGHLQRLAYILAQQEEKMGGLEALLAFMARWVDPKEGLAFFGSRGEARLANEVPDTSPLYPIAAIYCARMRVWNTLESSGIYPYPDRREAQLGPARRLFALARIAFPENRVVRMYLGERFPAPQPYEPVAGAPDWAVWQREALERLTDIIEWWIDHRMRDNGEYGGGWGDDCEMWRRWVPVLIGFDHPKINWAQGYFSEQLLRQPHLKGGYHNQLTDVEHTAEDLADALTPMMHLQPDQPEWAKRARRLVDLMEGAWTGRNQRGFLQFKSTYFTVDKVDLAPARACDTVYHPRAVQPALLYWLRTRDPRLTRLFSDWMDTWVDAAARAERGKPAGILPTAIHWPDGQVGGVGERWWQPENYGSPLYDFPSAMKMMVQTLLLTHHVTGHPRYLDPLHSMARIRLEYLEKKPAELEPGSLWWCAEKMGFLGETLAKYRFLTGDTRFDKFLERERLPYVQYRLRGMEAPLVTGFRQCADVLRDWWPGYTSEVRYTDRVFRFPALLEAGFMFKEGVPALVLERGALAPGLNALDLLYSTTTGDPGDALYFPMNAVRWHTPPRDIAALVVDSGRDRLSAQLYHFGTGARPMEAELFLLQKGEYGYELSNKQTGLSLDRGRLSVPGPGARLRFELPARTVCLFQIKP